jgi:hypothetical protein
MKDRTGRTLTPWNCQTCGKAFYARKHDVIHRNRRSCSRSCAQQGKFNGNFKGGTAESKLTKKYITKFPEKHAARRLFVDAVRRGRIQPQPCFVCGKANADGHHWDYAKPYEVFWLCRGHHKIVHRGAIALPLPSYPIIPAVIPVIIPEGKKWVIVRKQPQPSPLIPGFDEEEPAA